MPALSARVPPTGRFSARRREGFRCWSFLTGNFAGTEQPLVLASAPETERLQAHDPTGVLGFNWGIDPASPAQVREAQTGMEHRPPGLDHDALADSIVEHRTVYHFYAKSAWTLVDMPD